MLTQRICIDQLFIQRYIHKSSYPHSKEIELCSDVAEEDAEQQVPA